MNHNVLVSAQNLGEDNLQRLSKAANVHMSWKLDDNSLVALLPETEVLVVFFWPRWLTEDRLRSMGRLGFVQSVLVGVNHIPFAALREDVIVSSNAGGYSLEVAEHAFGLLLSGAKRVVEHHDRIQAGAKSLSEFSGEAAGIVVLQGKTFGIVGYGSIGKAAAGLAKSFGMKVLTYGRRKVEDPGTRSLTGREGLDSLLRESDAILLSIPLTNTTQKMIGQRELSLMKDNAILVNIARGDLLDQGALYSHLKGHPNFRYATDVWWYKNGQETLETTKPLASLPNFIGTPHMSGPTGNISGRPGNFATDNVLRYLRGQVPLNVVDRTEYEGM